MAFGQVRSSTYTDDKTLDGLEGFMLEAGGKLPPGTRVPGIYAGFDGQAVQNGRDVYMPVTSVTENTPAADSGLKIGDKVWKVNGSVFKNEADFHSRLNKLGDGNRYTIEIEREGTRQTLTLVAKERPVVGSPEWDALEAAGKKAKDAAKPAA